jgi:hypothetical protein
MVCRYVSSLIVQAPLPFVSINDSQLYSPGTLNLPIPSDTSIGAFAVARPQDANNDINAYILWQDASGTIQMSWQDDESGWKGPSTFPAFRGADSGTSITCLTPSAWPHLYYKQNGIYLAVIFRLTVC